MNSGNEDVAFDELSVVGTSGGGQSDVSIDAFSNTCIDELTLNWTLPGDYSAGDDQVLVFAKASSAITAATPSTGVGTYTADADFSGSGTVYENDASAKCVYSGDGTSVTITGLTSNTTYHFLIYNVETAGPTYSSGVTDNQGTLSALDEVSSYAASNGNTSADLSWTNPTTCYDEILIVARASSNVSATPSGMERAIPRMRPLGPGRRSRRENSSFT